MSMSWLSQPDDATQGLKDRARRTRRDVQKATRAKRIKRVRRGKRVMRRRVRKTERGIKRMELCQEKRMKLSRL